MRRIEKPRRDLTLWSALCILFLTVPVHLAWGQSGNGGGGNDGKERVEVMLDAYQCSSVDLATFTIDGQSWSPSSAGDGCGRGQAGTHSFLVRKGVEHSLRAHAIEAIKPDDGNVSLWWNVWTEDDGVLIDWQTPDDASPISNGGHPMPEPAYTVVAPIVSIRSIAFSGDYQQPLVSDPGVTGDYGSPQWEDWDMSGTAGDHPLDRRAPVLFAGQGQAAEASRADLATRFSVVPDLDLQVLWGGTFRVRGDGPTNTLSFPPTAVPDCVWGAVSQECEAANSLGAFDKEVSLWEQDELQFTWTYTFDEGCGNDDPSCWVDAGQSDHLMYVSYKPAADPDEHPLYHSLVHLGCEAAEGASDDESVLNAIWENGFKPLDVRRVTPEGEKEDTPLTYHGKYETTIANAIEDTSGLLQYGDGICGAWSRFFIDSLKAQGLRYETYIVSLFYPYPDDLNNGRFLVENWTPAAGGGTAPEPYAYRLVKDDPWIIFHPGQIPDFSYQWAQADMLDESGIEAQGNPNPDAVFGYHVVVSISEPGVDYHPGWIHYDPSYGVSYFGIENIKKTIDGYGYYNPGSDQFFFKPNSPSEFEFGVLFDEY